MRFCEREKGLGMYKGSLGKMVKLNKTTKGKESGKSKRISKRRDGSGANIIM